MAFFGLIPNSSLSTSFTMMVNWAGHTAMGCGTDGSSGVRCWVTDTKKLLIWFASSHLFPSHRSLANSVTPESELLLLPSSCLVLLHYRLGTVC